MSLAAAFAERLGRVLLLLILVAAGTIALIRFAPGYFSDVREMDARYAERARSELRTEQLKQGSFSAIARITFGGWLKGDFGRSRQYDAPVSELIRPRLAVSISLLAHGIINGWLLAFLAALFVSASRKHAARTILSVPFTLLLAVPTGAMATLCMLADMGGPVLVLSLLLAARDFKFLRRLLDGAWRAPHLLQARAQGLRIHRIVIAYLLPSVMPQLLALATLSLVTALSAIVPIEVIFDRPGIGQLAWSAAMNRDLPVLLTVTLLMASAVGCANLFSQRLRPLETA